MADVVSLPSLVVPYEIEIDVAQRTVMTSSYSKQYDSGVRFIVASLYANGSPFPLDTSYTIYFAGTQNHTDGVLNELKGINGDGIDGEGRIIYKVKDTDTNTIDSYDVEFRIVDSSLNMISTPKFRLQIEKSALQDSIPIIVNKGSAMLSIKSAIDSVDQIKTAYDNASKAGTTVAVEDLKKKMLYIEAVENVNQIPLDAGLLDGHPSSYYAKENSLVTIQTTLSQIIQNVTVDSEVIAARGSAVRGVTYGTLDLRLEADEQELVNKVKFKTSATAVGGETNVVHNLTYDPTHDELEVIYYGCVLEKNINYTENANNISIDLRNWSLKANDKVYFKVYRYVK